MSSVFTRMGSAKREPALMTVLLLTAVGVGACTEVPVQETRVLLNTSATCGSNNNNGTGGFNNGGNQQPQMSSAVMDTYIVQVFEFYDPSNATTNTCDDCLARRQDPTAAQLCFLERETCICGEQTSVSPATLPGGAGEPSRRAARELQVALLPADHGGSAHLAGRGAVPV